jgi:hypothetical protein
MNTKTKLNNNSQYLFLGIISIIGAAAIFWVCFNFSNSGAAIHVKPGYSSWAWGGFSLLSSFYYFISSKGKKISGGYVNPVFQKLLYFANLIPFIGFLISYLNSLEFILNSLFWKNLVLSSQQFLDSIIILFVFSYFGTGVGNLKKYFKK